MPDNDDLCLSINGISHPILCGICKQKITFTGEPNVDSGQAGCLSCDNIADVQEVARIATEYSNAEAQLILNRMARDTAKKIKFMKFSGQTEHNQTYKFIVKDLRF